MGIKERQQRDRNAVHRAILDAARDLFVTEGFQNVSIRKVAERIEYSPAAIYGYFPCKDDIFFALAEEGFHLLGGADPGRREYLESLPPLERVRENFWRVYEFSREHPQYFALMFVDRDVPRISREYERFAFVRDMKHEIVTRVQQCIDANVLPSTLDASVVTRLLIMAVLGVGAMRLSGRLGTPEQADLIASDMLNTLLWGLKSGVPLQSIDAPCMAEERTSAVKVS